MVETGCRSFASVAFPDRLAVGVRVTHLGRSGVRYAIALFRKDDAWAAAQGRFVHVPVDRRMRRPAALPEPLRTFLLTIVRERPAPGHP